MSQHLSDPSSLDRRQFLQWSAAAGAAGLLYATQSHARTLSTDARIVIIGGGAGGMAMANRLARRLDGAHISLIEPSETHFYQPGYTLVASGVWRAEQTARPNTQFVPRDRKSTRLNSSHVAISYAVFCLQKKKHETGE